MNRRQLLVGTGAAGVAWASTGGTWGFARAASLTGAGTGGRPVRMDGGISAELGGIVNGTFALRTTSVTHRTLI